MSLFFFTTVQEKIIMGWHTEVSIGQKVDDIPHPKVRFEGGACVMTEVGEGMVG